MIMMMMIMIIIIMVIINHNNQIHNHNHNHNHNRSTIIMYSIRLTRIRECPKWDDAPDDQKVHFVIESCERNLMVSMVAISNEFEGAVGWPEYKIFMHTHKITITITIIIIITINNNNQNDNNNNYYK